MRPVLPVKAGEILWRRSFSGNTSGSLNDGGPVLSSNRIAFPASDYVYFVNKDGSGEQRVKNNAWGFYPSALVADLDGNVYYATPDGLFSVDANGSLRWSHAITPPANIGEFAMGLTPVLAPDGVVYFATHDQAVGAYRTSDGKLLWSRPGPESNNIWRAQVMGGGGKGLFVAYDGVYPDARTDALDTRDGSRLGSFVRPAYGASFTWEWGAWVEGWDLGVGYGNIYVFDTCGNLRWSGTPQGAGVVASGELLAISTDTRSGTLLLSDMHGNVVAGPAPAEGWPVAAGADGSIYMFRCDDAATSTNRILAYSHDLQELWRLDLGGDACKEITGNVILDDAGVMYFIRKGGSPTTTEVIAIQTASPGLADSSWPSFRHDNRGTAWLVPGVGNTDPTDGGDQVDAPEPQGD
ncbi:MAG: PQQ-like beta-propeller repeat protein [Deltaproteobacteria bacterium]|nr:PQQ-like beta-propeller repeat protein [Deltaproteobacteria bacterium]